MISMIKSTIIHETFNSRNCSEIFGTRNGVKIKKLLVLEAVDEAGVVLEWYSIFDQI